MDECHGERDLVDWPPVISLTQDGHEGNSVGSDHTFSSSQTKKAAKGTKKQIARQVKNRNRRVEQKKKKRELSQIQHGPARDDSMGGGVTTNCPMRLFGRTLFSLRRNLKKQKDRMVTHLCPGFDVEDTIRNIRKAQPGSNKDPDFETFDEPTLELIKGEIVTLTDKFVISMISLIGYSRSNCSY